MQGTASISWNDYPRKTLSYIIYYGASIIIGHTWAIGCCILGDVWFSVVPQGTQCYWHDGQPIGHIVYRQYYVAYGLAVIPYNSVS